jgi:hypothetical protein
MSIEDQYRNKTIAILNAESAIGRVLLRKIVSEFSEQLNTIIIINIATKNESRTRAASLQ